MTIEVLYRGRFVAIDDATARAVGPNAWEIALPADSSVHQQVRRTPTVDGWDGAVFAIDGVELEPAVGSGEDRRGVRVTALAL